MRKDLNVLSNSVIKLFFIINLSFLSLKKLYKFIRALKRSTRESIESMKFMDHWSVHYGTDARALPRNTERYRQSSSLIRGSCVYGVLRKSGASTAAWLSPRTRARSLDHWRSIVNVGRTVARSVRIAPRDRTFRFVALRSARRRMSARAARLVEYVQVWDINSLLITVITDSHFLEKVAAKRRWTARSFDGKSSETSTAIVAIIILFAKWWVLRDVTWLTS